MTADNLILTGRRREARGWLPWRRVTEMQVERVVVRPNGAIERTMLWVRASRQFLAWL